MEYNKRQFAKANDKKILHKVKKHWVVMSMALLMALGGEAAATHVSAHADTTNNNQQTSNTNTLRERLNSSLEKTSSNPNQANQNSANKAQSHIQQNTTQNNTNPNQTNSAIQNRANTLHQRIVQNALTTPKVNNQVVNAPSHNLNSANSAIQNNVTKVGRTTVQDPKNVAQLNSDKQTALTNHQVVNTPIVGSNNADVNSNMVINYIDTTTHKTINQQRTSSYTNDPFNMQSYLNDLPQGYDLDNKQDNNSDGWTDDNGTKHQNANKAADYPNVYQQGTNNLFVYVTPHKTAGRGYINIEYENSSNNEEENKVTLSNSDGDTINYNDIKGYLQTAPAGFNIVNYGTYNNHDASKDAGDVDPNSTWTYTSTPTDIVIKVTPISNPNSGLVQGTITYENAADGDAFVSSVPFKEPKGENITSGHDWDHFTKYVPNGYKYDSAAETTSDYDPTWENGDNDLIMVEPDGTDRNIPTAQPGYSFISVKYYDDNTHQIVNQINLTGKDGTKKNESDASFNASKYENLVPDKYQYTGHTDNGNLNAFPNQDGKTATMTVHITLKPSDDPNSPQYNPASANTYASATIHYEDYNTHSDLSSVVSDVHINNVKPGTPINYNDYTRNLPSGYQYAGMGQHNDRVYNYEQGSNANIIYLKKINTNAQPITVDYWNQYGKNVGSATDNYGSLDSYIDVTKNSNGSSNVPKGYQVTAHENTTYQVTNDRRTVNVLVTGKSVTQPSNPNQPNSNPIAKPLTFHFARYVSKDNGQNYKRISDYTQTLSNPVIGQEINITPSTIAPNGYQPAAANGTNNQNNVTEAVKQDGTGFAPISANAPAAYYYTEVPGGSAANVKPITVKYQNQRGDYVPDADGQISDTLNGSDGQPVNVINPTGRHIEMPKGYHLAGNGQNTIYTYKDTPQTAVVLVAGDSVNGNNDNGNNNKGNNNDPAHPDQKMYKNEIAVVQKLNSSQGIKTQYKYFNISGQVGDKITVAPNGFSDGSGSHSLIPANYHADPNDPNYNVKVDSDGTLSGVNNNTITYNYDKNYGKIHINYFIGAYGPDFILDSGKYNYDDSGEIGTSLPSNITDNIPNGYIYDSQVGASGDTTFNSTTGTYNIPVEQATNMTINYYDVTGGQHNFLSSKQIAGVSGNPFTLPQSDTEFVPAGYSYKNVENGVPTTYTNGGQVNIDVTKAASGPINTNLGEVHIHYMNSTNTNDTNSADQVGETDLSSDVGHNFNANDFKNNVPYGYTYNANQNISALSKITQYNKSLQNAYVYVTRNPSVPIPTYSKVKIEYDDVNNGDQPVGNPIEIQGKTNTPINYNQYTSVMPSGYEYTGVIKGTTNFQPDHNGNEATEHILVAKPAPAYGNVTVKYYSVASDGQGNPVKNGQKTLMNSDTIVSRGRNGSSFNISTYENSTPNGYSFNSVEGNQFVDYYNGGNQTVNIDVTKNPVPHHYGTVTVNYVDKDHHHDTVSEKETGMTGDVFDVGPFEHSAPDGSTFAGIDGSASQIPDFYPAYGDNSKTVNLYVVY